MLTATAFDALLLAPAVLEALALVVDVPGRRQTDWPSLAVKGYAYSSEVQQRLSKSERARRLIRKAYGLDREQPSVALGSAVALDVQPGCRAWLD